MCYAAEFGRSGSNGTRVIKKTAWKIWSPRPAFQGHSSHWNGRTRIDV